MKIRVGFGLGVRTRLHDSSFSILVDDLERLGFDSLWLSERIGGEAPDPVTAIAFAAGRTTQLKFGMSVLVLPGRNPIVLAKQLATIDQLSGGRLLPAFGLGVADPHEQQAFGVQRNERAAIFDEALAVLRGAWAPGSLTHHGERFHYDDLRVLPKPVQQPIDVWLGGIAESELRRVGRLADGWLPSFVTPGDVERGRGIVEASARAHDRSIDPEHFGALIPYTVSERLPAELLAGLRKRRPDVADPSELVALGWPALQAQIGRFVDVGFSKFVVVPVDEPALIHDWSAHLAEAAGMLLPLQS
jgi:probable F420-dependent oxidoreductase